MSNIFPFPCIRFPRGKICNLIILKQCPFFPNIFTKKQKQGIGPKAIAELVKEFELHLFSLRGFCFGIYRISST